MRVVSLQPSLAISLIDTELPVVLLPSVQQEAALSDKRLQSYKAALREAVEQDLADLKAKAAAAQAE